MRPRESAQSAERIYRGRVSAGFRKLLDSLRRAQSHQRNHEIDGLSDGHSRPQLLDLASDGIDAMMSELMVLRKQNEDLLTENAALKHSLLPLGQVNTKPDTQTAMYYTPTPASQWNSVVVPQPLPVASSAAPFRQGLTPSSHNPRDQRAASNGVATIMGLPLYSHNNLTALPTYNYTRSSPSPSRAPEWQQAWDNPDFQAYYSAPPGQPEYNDRSAI